MKEARQSLLFVIFKSGQGKTGGTENISGVARRRGAGGVDFQEARRNLFCCSPVFCGSSYMTACISHNSESYIPKRLHFYCIYLNRKMRLKKEINLETRIIIYFLLSLYLIVGSSLVTRSFLPSFNKSILSAYCILGIVGSMVSRADTSLPS